MQTANALKMRQNMGSAVFVDIVADSARRKIVDEIKASKIQLPLGVSSLQLIQNLRNGFK